MSRVAQHASVSQELRNEEEKPVDTGHISTDATSESRGIRFWLIMLALGFSLFLPPLELTSVSTALPTIINDLRGTDFIWITSAYTLASSAVLPLSGSIANTFGRRPSILLALALFTFGSALCGSAQNVPWLIAGRTVQGMGGGCIISIVNIIISDLIPLHKRGAFSGILGMVWAIAAAIGPLIGGAFANNGQWRWLFYLNLPICGVAFALVFLLLNLPKPEGSFKEKLISMDWIGNFLVISSTSALIIALTSGGNQFQWTSVHVLLPLIVGAAGLILVIYYEKRYAKLPIMPYVLFTNRTTLSGYLQTLINHTIVTATIYYLPAYYQACKGASAIASGVDSLGFSLILGPVVILCGLSVTKFQQYRVQSWIGWVILLISMGLLSTIKANSLISHSIGVSVLTSIGGGMISSITYFPILSPLPVSQSAPALALLVFCRSFAAIWGVTIGGVILQNQLSKRLPNNFSVDVPGGAYAAIPSLVNLQEPLRTELREAFADSIAVIWKVMAGLAALGLLCSLVMKAIPMQTKVDKKWGPKQYSEKETKEEILPDDV